MTDGTSTGGEQKPGLRERIGSRAWVRSAALVGGGLVAGGILAGSIAANAADDGGRTTGPSTERSDGHGGGHHGRPGAGEEALTGDTADAVEEAVLEEYPDATFERLETDSDGVYEAHITTVDGEELTVELDGDLAVTGTE